MEKERCPRCNGKVVYKTWKHAQADARAMNRKKRRTGHMEAYMCPAGCIHVGRRTPPEVHRPRKTKPGKRWRWRQERDTR